jgi:aldehyde:ferredoxin oxidoreductase
VKTIIVAKEKTMKNGVTGKILWVNLSKGTTEVVKPEADLYQQFLGGYGIGAKLIYERQKPGLGPLDPENILGFASGPLTGTPAISSSRYTVMGKSPLTGTWGDANSGGFFGPALKRSGFDAVFFEGASTGWVYLCIEDGKAELVDATPHLGLDTTEFEDKVKAERGNTVRIASIGPAGEKCSLLSCIINDKWRAAARSGLGALMGSKKLKAIVVKDEGSIPIADEEKAREQRQKMIAGGKNNPLFQLFSGFGTCGIAAMAVESGDAPVKNWTGTGNEDFPNAAAISDQSVMAYQKKKYACFGCPIACGGEVTVEKGPYACETHKPEYETLGALGPLCLNDNLESIIKINDICNRAGLDTISVGAAIAFAIECYENGVLTQKDTGGCELTWGNHQEIVSLSEKIARREGLGELLADGVKSAAEKIGKGAEAYAIHVGGQELPMHDPRNTPGYGTTYCTDATPARHMQGGSAFLESQMPIAGVPFKIPEKYTYTGKGDAHRFMSNISHIVNVTGLCYFALWVYGINMIPQFMESVTGEQYSLDDLLVIGERIANLRMAFNQREGVTFSQWEVPGRMIGDPPLQAGPLKGITIDLKTLTTEYCEKMGWDPKTGKPSSEKLEELNLTNVSQDF